LLIPEFPTIFQFRAFLISRAFFFRINSGFPTKIAKQTAAITCSITPFGNNRPQNFFVSLTALLLQNKRIYAIIKAQ